ncbi:MAG: (Fe-S)-binding protein, partial [Peptococcus niger]
DLNDLYPGNNYEVPIDKKGADILLIHNAGEYMAWPENPMAFEILFNEAGLSWTLSSDMIGYDNVNYGIWYDDKMARDIALQQIEAAKKLGVNRIVVGECGHAHKAISVVSDRFSPAKDRVPVESFLPMLRDLVLGGTYDLDPMRNDFAVTLHDPCNFVRQMGVVQPQRDIINAVVPKGRFMEMYPHGVDNYCCGGGSGFAIMNSLNFPAYRENISTRMKLKQVLDAFGPENIYDKDLVKYICAPCSNCKGTFREMLKYWGLTENYNFQYAGLVELVVNAMTKFDTPYFEWMRDDADEFSMM